MRRSGGVGKGGGEDGVIRVGRPLAAAAVGREMSALSGSEGCGNVREVPVTLRHH